MMKELSTALGNIRIHKDVVRSIVFQVLKDFEGIKRLHYSLGDRILKIFKPSGIFPVKVRLDKDSIRIRVPVVVSLNQDLAELAVSFQEKVGNVLKEHFESASFQVDIDIRGVEKEGGR